MHILHLYILLYLSSLICTLSNSPMGSLSSPPFSFKLHPYLDHAHQQRHLPPMPTHSMTCAHPCPPMLFKVCPCIQKLCNVYYAPRERYHMSGEQWAVTNERIKVRKNNHHRDFVILLPHICSSNINSCYMPKTNLPIKCSNSC